MALGGLYRRLYERQHGLIEDLFINPGEEPPIETSSPRAELAPLVSRTGRDL
jgi:hypothetical protein